ncbi:MAG: AAA family ATPase [Candidatus Heimdallarchaeaceae archaeon]
MTIHLSARLAWHDKGWNGCICDNPKLNVSCMVHEHIRDGRNEGFETKNAGKSLRELPIDQLPPCSRDPGAFSPMGFTIIHYDPLDWRNLPPAKEEIPPYSFCTSPYGRMFKENSDEWENNPKKQLKSLNEFWDKIEPGKSLVFFYVNHGNPLREEKSDRILVGIGRISKMGKQMYFGKKRGWDDDYPLWSRCIIHNFPEEGIRLPYQEYIEKGWNPSNIICTVPASARPYFSYVAEHVSDDIAAGILERVIQSVNVIIAENKISEPYGKTWEYRLEWLNKVLEEVWRNRGRFPSIGSILEYLGFKHGITYHRTVLSSKEANGENIFDFVFLILDGEREVLEEQQDNFKRASKKWNELPEERRKLLKVLSHFELSREQIERICNPTKRKEAFIEASKNEIIENPYIISELDDGSNDSPPIDFETIDRGVIPSEDICKVKGALESITKDDNRRVRALLVEILKAASQGGDTFLSVDEAIKRVRKRLPENRLCEPERDIILHNRRFYEERLSFFPDKNPRVIALKSLHQQEEKIKERLIKMVEKEHEQKIDTEFWRQLIEEELKTIRVFDEEIEEKAREEKAMALNKLFSFRLSVLTGRAGTGKTTVLKVFIRGLEEKEGKQQVLLLAPTGKARVRLQEITKKEAQTIHQFLMKLGWIREETFSLKEEGRKQGASNVIIDEASMIPTDLLATLFRAIEFNDVKRLILVGDPNQLPPIGPGRPFVDIIKWLESSEDKEKHIARLSQRVRHEHIESQALKLADAFLGDRVSLGDDEILSKVAKGEVSRDLEVHFWNDEKELYELLDKSLKANIALAQNEEFDYEKFNKSIVKPDNWQILSPTRMQVFGTTEINRIVQKKYRQGLIKKPKDKNQDLLESNRWFGMIKSSKLLIQDELAGKMAD